MAKKKAQPKRQRRARGGQEGPGLSGLNQPHIGVKALPGIRGIELTFLDDDDKSFQVRIPGDIRQDL